MPEWVPQVVRDADGEDIVIDVMAGGLIQITPPVVGLLIGPDGREEFGRAYVMACHEAERQGARDVVL